MSATGDSVSVAKVVIKEKSTPWLIWLLPIIALCVGGWLVYKSYRNVPTKIVMYFPLGSNLKPNETELKFESVRLGVVTATRLTSDLKGIEADIDVAKKASIMLQEDTVFWLVSPKITMSRVSGLDTIVTGSYITMQLGETTSKLTRDEFRKLKPSRFEYTALHEPPPRPVYLGGLQLQVSSTGASAISEGAPVTFKKFTVGEVDNVSLSKDGKVIQYRLFIEDEYKHLINTKTRFWNASGITLKGALTNIEFKMDSLNSVLVGGVSFGNEPSEDAGGVVENFHEFVLFEDQNHAFSKKTLIKIRFSSGDGLTEGTPVKYNGLQIGEVETITLQKDLKSVIAGVNIYEMAVNSLREDSKFWMVKPELGLANTRNLDTLVSGRYITLQPGTGKSARQFVALNEPPFMQLSETGKHLKIVLLADQRGSIKQDTKVYYRNVEVGRVTGTELSSDANQVRIHVAVDHLYAPLVRENTKFWNASGIDVGFKVFGGLKMKTESVESLLEGGVAFATPDNPDMGSAVSQGATFKLYDKVDESWEKWSPSIPLREVK